MAVYIVLFALTIILAVPLVMKNPTKPKKAVYIAIMFTLMYLVSVFRYGIGNDYFSYIRIFQWAAETDLGGIISGGIEPFFAVITKGISLFTANPEVMYAVYAALILIPAAWAIYRYSDNAWLSVAVYLCLTLFYNSLNFIRQSMAASLLILAYGFMKEKKVLPVLIFGVCAVMFHYTAAVFIPLYLLSLIRPTKKYIIIFSSVSVTVLVTCLIMKAAGANPLNLAANVMTAITGMDYSGYIDSMWFETGLGPEYLIMPLAFLAVVLISYFCGWKEKPEADMLLQFALMNAAIWSFITYAFIVERFSMFIFIFSVFTVPSLTEYFAEKARDIEKKEVTDKKVPGYSKKKAEEKKDSSFLLTVGITVGMFAYNCFSMALNFHGVFPYVCMYPEIESALNGSDSREKTLYEMYFNADLYSYLIQLKSSGCGYIAVSTGTEFGLFTPAVRRADEYAGTRLRSALLGNPAAGDGAVIYKLADGTEGVSYSAYSNGLDLGNGISVTGDGQKLSVSDSYGTDAALNKGKLSFFIISEAGEILDATEFDVSAAKRSAAKIAIGPANQELSAQ